MKPLPIHRTLVTVAILFVLGAAAVNYFLVYPVKRAAQQEEEDNDSTASELKSQYGNYRLEPSDLEQKKSKLRIDKREVFRQLMKVAELAATSFDARLRGFNGVEGFRNSITQLDYQEKLSNLAHELGQMDITLDEEVLGMSLEMASTKTYRLVAHLWVVEDLALATKRHDLSLKSETMVTRRIEDIDQEITYNPARISALPVVAYRTSSSDEAFLEEYPVKLTVRGDIEDFCNFLLDLTAAGKFIPMKKCLVRKHGLADIGAKTFDFDQIEATITCSAFLILKEAGELEQMGEEETELNNIPGWQPGA